MDSQKYRFTNDGPGHYPVVYVVFAAKEKVLQLRGVTASNVVQEITGLLIVLPRRCQKATDLFERTNNRSIQRIVQAI